MTGAVSYDDWCRVIWWLVSCHMMPGAVSYMTGVVSYDAWCRVKWWLVPCHMITGTVSYNDWSRVRFTCSIIVVSHLSQVKTSVGKTATSVSDTTMTFTDFYHLSHFIQSSYLGRHIYKCCTVLENFAVTVSEEFSRLLQTAPRRAAPTAAHVLHHCQHSTGPTGTSEGAPLYCWPLTGPHEMLPCTANWPSRGAPLHSWLVLTRCHPAQLTGLH